MWKLMEPIAELSLGKFSLEVNFVRPVVGLQAIQCDANELEIKPMQITGQPASDRDEPIDEVYIRGDDLIAIYNMASKRTARPEIVWTASGDERSLTLDVTIAMQTPLLDSDPSLSTKTEAKSCDILAAVDQGGKLRFEPADAAASDSVGLFLFRPDGSDFSYAEMVYPTDLDRSKLELSDDLLQYGLISEFLEKGVIRKARLRGMLLPREVDTELAFAGFEDLCQAAPPLTT